MEPSEDWTQRKGRSSQFEDVGKAEPVRGPEARRSVWNDGAVRGKQKAEPVRGPGGFPEKQSQPRAFGKWERPRQSRSEGLRQGGAFQSELSEDAALQGKVKPVQGLSPSWAHGGRRSRPRAFGKSEASEESTVKGFLGRELVQGLPARRIFCKVGAVQGLKGR